LRDPINTPPRVTRLDGRRFERLVAIHPVERRKNGHTVYACRCDCGTEVEATCSNLKSAHTQSCGCLMRERTSAANKRHGMGGTRIYRVWSQMMQRCYKPYAKNYKWYGARGITVDARWHDFANFYADMGEAPAGMTLDRERVNEPYGPCNCRWASWGDQANNNRRNRRVTHDGRTQTVAQWARELGVQPEAIGRRLRRGWSVERAFTGLNREITQ
jgi:hypothetical protein